MLVTSSQSVRSLVVRLNKGEDLAESLASLITSQRITVATVQGHGALEAVILDSYDARARTYGDARTFTGRLELISLQGHLSTREGHPDLYLHAAVARDTGNGVEVLGGRLIEAQVVAVELTLLLHDDLPLERTTSPIGTSAAAQDQAAFFGSSLEQATTEEAAPATRSARTVVLSSPSDSFFMVLPFSTGCAVDPPHSWQGSRPVGAPTVIARRFGHLPPAAPREGHQALVGLLVWGDDPGGGLDGSTPA